MVIIYMKKFLHFDWLRAVQYFSKTVQKRVNTVQNKPSILIGQWSKKLTDGQSNLDGAIDGVIFPWLRDTRAFLLFYTFEIFSCILLISNHMIFLVQFGINKHL